jgi:hypothetical protein
MAGLTPHIDPVAKEGIRFTNAYRSGCVCSPSRAGLVTCLDDNVGKILAAPRALEAPRPRPLGSGRAGPLRPLVRPRRGDGPAAVHPDRVKAMLSALATWEAALEAPRWRYRRARR